MSELAHYVAAVLARPTLAGRRRELARVPLHLRADLETEIRRLWPQRRRQTDGKSNGSGAERCL